MPPRKKAEPTPAAVVPTEPPRSVGRPSAYTDAFADAVCERMLNGESLVKICEDVAMPSRTTVYRWMDARPDFVTRCARAREGLADFLVDDIQTLADATTELNVQSQKVKIATKQWRAMKIAPRTYGDRTQTALTGADGGPIRIAATTIDARQLEPDARDALKQALFAAKRLAAD
jgi:hypothetical protein